jgi:hypothetical protein
MDFLRADGKRSRGRLRRAAVIGILALAGVSLGGCVETFSYTASGGYGYYGSCGPVYYGPAYGSSVSFGYFSGPVGYYGGPVCGPRYGYYRGGACGW